MNKINFWNTTAIYTLGFLGLRALSFILLPLYTNLLTTYEAGILFIIYTILAFLNTIYNRGMDSALLKFFNETSESSIISTSILYSLLQDLINRFCGLGNLTFLASIGAWKYGPERTICPQYSKIICQYGQLIAH